MLNILITGGAGYIGRRLVHKYLKGGHSVTVLDAFTKNRPYPKEFTVGDNQVKCYEGDVRSLNDIEVVFAENAVFDCIFHLAAETSVLNSGDVGERRRITETNVTGTSNIIDAANDYGRSPIVFASSAAVYGEAQYRPIMEGHPLAPHTLYGETKVLGELAIMKAAVEGRLNSAVIARLFNPIGVHQPCNGSIVDAIQNWLDNITSDPIPLYGSLTNCKRDYIHLDDVVRFLVSAEHWVRANRFAAACPVLNVCNEVGVRTDELIRMFEYFYGMRIETTHEQLRHGEVRESIGSHQAATMLLGWRPMFTLHDAVGSLCGERRKDD